MSRTEAIQSLGFSPDALKKAEAEIASGNADHHDIEALGDAEAMIQARMKGEDPYRALFYRAASDPHYNGQAA